MNKMSMLDEVLRFLKKNPDSFILLDVFCENRWGYNPTLLEELKGELLAMDLIEVSATNAFCIKITEKGYYFPGFAPKKKKESWISRFF